MGTIINQNTGDTVSEQLDVMLHVLDQNYAEAGMLHGQSLTDGRFLFAEAPFEANFQYAVMATFEGVTYFSDVVPVDMTSMQVSVDVPVYDSTSDLTNVQVDQMHVLFNFAEDGMETKEIYILSNTGARTVKDVYELDADKTATLEFPLPSDADFIFFKPDDQDRFIKLDGGFADTYPILPGAGSAQIMVNYLTPFSNGRTYTYIAPLNILSMNFLINEESNVTLQGQGLAGPERMTLEDGKSYLVYSHPNLGSGEKLQISFIGNNASAKANGGAIPPLIAGVAVLGLALMGYGFWWWRKSDNVQSDDGQSDDAPLDELIREIAQLDEKHEQGQLGLDEYQHMRKELMGKAKRLM
ncbi:MAG: hypothetical protein DCC56_01730 [Anaerolineae bacterium]|nr:MAG: hypothetical protein DCC56_01730 [Anaerolineae bacterium]